MFEREKMVEENTNYGQHMQGMIPFPHMNKMQHANVVHDTACRSLLAMSDCVLGCSV
jgi:hypothetical protein